MGSIWTVSAAVSLACVVASCTALPAQGPSTTQVLDPNTSQPTATQAGYLVADLNSQTEAIATSARAPTLRSQFGDNRPAPDPLIGVGDGVTVTIWEAASGGLFSTPVSSTGTPGSHTATIPEQVVARDGSITVPYAGRIHVANMAPPAVEEKIVAALAGKAIEPQVLLTVSHNVANAVTVLGEVNAGARVPLSSKGDRILDVIASAGGIRAAAHETFVTLSRDGRSVSVPLQTLLDRPDQNIFAHPGDTVTLVRDPQTFTAFGATGRNSVIPFDARGITLEEAVAKSGGLIELQSDPSGVFLLRDEPVSIARALDPRFPIDPNRSTIPVVYRINLRDTNTYFLARHFPVRNKDMIYVASAPSTDLQKFLSIVQMSTGPVLTGKALGM